MLRIERRGTVFTGAGERPSCHCASLVALTDGTLLCVWYAGTREGAPDVALLGARLDPGASDWTSVGVLSNAPNQPEGNAIPFTPDGREVQLLYATIEGRRWTDCSLKRRTSHDGGFTWSEPEVWRAEWGWLVRAPVQRLADGAWLLPAYDERSWEGLMLVAENSRDWREVARIAAPPGIIQPAVAATPDGGYVAYLRPGGKGGVLWRSRSMDGRSWTAAEPSDQPNPNSGLDLLGLPDGRLILANNPTLGGRSPLTLCLSEDAGESWRAVLTLEDAPGEWSYPQMTLGRDGRVHLVYTANRQAIAHAVIAVA